MSFNTSDNNITPLRRLLNMLSLDRKDIHIIYFYSVVSGLIALSLPLGIQSIINFIMAGQVSKSWIILVVVVVLGVVMSGVLTIFQLSITEAIQQRIFYRSATEFTYRIPRLKIEKLNDQYAPQLINRFFDTLTIQKGISKIIIDAPAAILQIFFGIILLSFYHPLFVGFGAITILAVALVFVFTFPRGLKTSMEESTYKYKVAFWLEELARVIGTFKLAGDAPIARTKTDTLVAGYIRARKAHFRILVVQYANLIGFKAAITGILLMVGGFLVIDNQISIGQFVASEIIIVLIMNSSEKLLYTSETLFDLLTAVAKVGQVLDLPLEPDNSKSRQMTIVKDGPFSVKIENLTFYHDYAHKSKVLDNVNLDIQPGQVVVITGKSGSGKSHLLHLIAGNYVDFEGSVEIGGWPLRNWCKDTLRGNIGDFFSEENLFWGTIQENITMGNPVSIERLMEVSRALGLDDYINKLDAGYQTELNPEGNILPSHIRKKVLIARSIVYDPKLVLSEDLLQGLDKATQNKYLDLIFGSERTYTFIAVSHNVVMASRADLIVVMDDGKVVWQGPYDAFRVHPQHRTLI